MSFITQRVKFEMPIASTFDGNPVLIGNLEIDAIVNLYDNGNADCVDYNHIKWNGTCIYHLLQHFPEDQGMFILDMINEASINHEVNTRDAKPNETVDMMHKIFEPKSKAV